MDPEEAEAIVRAALLQDLGEKEALMPLTSRLREDMDFDELDYVEMCILLEKVIASPEAGAHRQVVAIPDEDMADWVTMQDMVDTVVKVTTPGYGRLP